MNRRSLVTASFASAVALTSLLGCAPRQDFMPVMANTLRTPENRAAVEYELLGPDRAPVAEVRVWSLGARRVEGRTNLHLGFEMRNDAETPIVLEPEALRIVSATVDDRRYFNIDPERITGRPAVAPGGFSQVDAHFVLPEGISPRDVAAFKAEWTLRNEDLRFVRRTPFAEEPRVRLPAYPYHDPFFRPGLIHHRRPFW